MTSFLPTIVSSSKEQYAHVEHALSVRDGSVLDGAGVLGMHYEGPFLNDGKYGAHRPEYVRTPRDLPR